MKNISKYYIWLTGIKKSWEEKNFDVLSDLFADDLEYFESPFGPPLTSKQDVINQWKKDLAGQTDIEFKYETLAAWEFYCIANWNARFVRDGKPVILDGIFYFKLNRENRCKYFKQWRVVK